MIYKPFDDLNISYLGMGNMRLPTVGGERRDPINEERQGRSLGIVKAIGVGMTDWRLLLRFAREGDLTVFYWLVAIRSWITVRWQNFFRTAKRTISAS